MAVKLETYNCMNGVFAMTNLTKKIMLLPLDERPCNYDYIAKMTGDTDFTIVLPPKEILSKKKQAGNISEIRKWILETAPLCSGAVISVDTLVYSGILPSRLHNTDPSELLERLEFLSILKSDNPALKIFAFSLIMRCPQYSSSDEEPDYYEDFGREIFKLGYIEHREELLLATTEETAELREIRKKLPSEHLDDYLGRRRKNLLINKRAIDLTKSGVIDFLIIPQDDSSPFGYTARDQKIIREHICSTEQQFNAYMYPDADAVENTLVARLINEAHSKRPMFYLKYASVTGDAVIPGFEDRPIGETIKYQIMASGGLIASSVNEADIILMINTPGGEHKGIGDTMARTSPAYAANRTQIELVEFAEYAMNVLKKNVCIADVAFSNGGDPDLFALLKIKGMLFTLSGYAGWNTSSNTLGTAIPMSILHFYYGQRQAHLDFLALRYLEDIGYMTYIRQDVTQNELEERGLTYFTLDGERGEVSKIIEQKLLSFANESLQDESYQVKLIDCHQPWNRMFETSLTVTVEKKKDKRIFVC